MMLFGVGRSDGGRGSDPGSIFGESLLEEQQLLTLLSLIGLGLDAAVEGCVGGDEVSTFSPPPQHDPIFGTGLLFRPFALTCGGGNEWPFVTGLIPSGLIMGGGICG